MWVRGVLLERKNQGEIGNPVRELRPSFRELFFRNVVMLAFFVVVFEVPAALVIKNGELSHSLCYAIFFLALSFKGTGDEFFIG